MQWPSANYWIIPKVFFWYCEHSVWHKIVINIYSHTMWYALCFHMTSHNIENEICEHIPFRKSWMYLPRLWAHVVIYSTCSTILHNMWKFLLVDVVTHYNMEYW